jgi:uncharacterized protein (TIGR02145 family)
MFTSVAISAQVTKVEPVGVDYTNKTVSFRVRWNAGSRDATHLSKVWVWVDFLEITGNAPSDSWTRALISGTPVATSGTTSQETGNDKGFWLTGNASTNYSATVSVQLSITADKFNWCAYASDYPPNVTGVASFTFKGTPPFIVKYSDGSTYSITSKTGYTPAAGKIFTAVISDGTKYPGGCIAPGGISTFADFVPCPGVANTSTWTLTDTRDSRKYRVVQMPDGKIWMGANLNYRGSGGTIGACFNNVAINCNDIRGALYTYTEATNSLCPSKWRLPSATERQNMITSVGVNPATKLKAKSPNWNGSDDYLFAMVPTGAYCPPGWCGYVGTANGDSYIGCQEGNYIVIMTNISSIVAPSHSWIGDTNMKINVRCLKN